MTVVIEDAPFNVGYRVPSVMLDALVGLYGSSPVYDLDAIIIIGGFTYAFDDDGVQIINITDPYNPINASSITNSTSYPTLNGANSIITATIGGSTYALVTAFDDDGVQIINIDDPYNPTNASSITDGTRYPTLNGASSITTVIIGGFTYALVASTYNSGVQIIRLSSPPLSIITNNPNPVTCKSR